MQTNTLNRSISYVETSTLNRSIYYVDTITLNRSISYVDISTLNRSISYVDTSTLNISISYVETSTLNRSISYVDLINSCILSQTMETPKPSNLYIENYLGSFYYDPITMTTVDKGEGDVKLVTGELIIFHDSFVCYILTY